MLCVASGMLLLVVGHQVWRARRTGTVERAIRSLQPLHDRIGTDNAYPATSDPETRLSRTIVEINDGARASRTVLTPEERAVLAAAEGALDPA